MKKILYYLNQFYGQIGGEEKADQPPLFTEAAVGPAAAVQAQIKDVAEVVGTIICGDNYFADNQNEALAFVYKQVESVKPDLLIAGPGFNAGRYGLACGCVCDAVQNQFHIPAITGLFPENPGAEMFKKTVYIIETGNNAASMRKAMPLIISLAKKILNGEPIGFPEEEGYIPQGYRVNVRMQECGAVRGVNMLLKKMRGEKFETELPMPVFDKVKPAPAVHDLKSAKIALITSGGIVPFGNPDHIESANATKFAEYDISQLEDLTSETHMTVHGGYDPVYATADPDRVLPVDAMKLLEKEHAFGELYDHYFATVGNATAVANAKKFAIEVAQRMKLLGIQAAILTSN